MMNLYNKSNKFVHFPFFSVYFGFIICYASCVLQQEHQVIQKYEIEQ